MVPVVTVVVATVSATTGVGSSNAALLLTMFALPAGLTLKVPVALVLMFAEPRAVRSSVAICALALVLPPTMKLPPELVATNKAPPPLSVSEETELATPAVAPICTLLFTVRDCPASTVIVLAVALLMFIVSAPPNVPLTPLKSIAAGVVVAAAPRVSPPVSEGLLLL